MLQHHAQNILNDLEEGEEEEKIPIKIALPVEPLPNIKYEPILIPIQPSTEQLMPIVPPGFEENKLSPKKEIKKEDEIKEIEEKISKEDEELWKQVQTFAKICKDQVGCRYLQKKLDQHNAQLSRLLFLKMYDDLNDHLIDPFGNYLTQKLIENLGEEELNKMIDKVESIFIQLSLNMHGTRCVQKLMECSCKYEKHITRIILLLKGNVVVLSTDVNGNHVLQKCFVLVPIDYKLPVYDELMKNLNKVSADKYGCCVVQKAIEHSSGNIKATLMQNISSIAYLLVVDPYGNYVIQYIIDCKNHDINAEIFKSLKGNLLKYANQKFSSNVIEKSLEYNSITIREVMVDEILKSDSYVEYLGNQYGNYGIYII